MDQSNCWNCRKKAPAVHSTCILCVCNWIRPSLTTSHKQDAHSPSSLQLLSPGANGRLRVTATYHGHHTHTPPPTHTYTHNECRMTCPLTYRYVSVHTETIQGKSSDYYHFSLILYTKQSVHNPHLWPIETM